MFERGKLTAKTSDSIQGSSVYRRSKARFDHTRSTVNPILFLQRTVGNQAVERLLKSGVIQAKLTIGQTGDVYEQEADRVAEQIMRMPDLSKAQGKGISEYDQVPSIQRVCTECEQELQRQPMEEEEELLQTKNVSGSTLEVTPGIEAKINDLRGGGQTLPESVRDFFEPRFGYDLSNVKLHTDAVAAKSAQSINALAYTTRNNIVFNSGQYSPNTDSGKRLLAHELTHVVQQSGSVEISIGQGNGQRGPLSISCHTHGLETNGGTLLQRDLGLRPTNPQPQEVNLTAEQIRDAINFNRRRYDAENTLLIQDVVGAPQTGTFDEETIRLVARYQDDFGLSPVDGKVGPDTFDQLTAELQAENVDDQTCLTMFNVTDPTDPLDIHVAGPGLADIFSRFSITARFSPHCNCDEFDYRQFICGSVDRTQGGVATNINNVFSIPGGGLPQCPGWVEDGNTTQPQNGRYGHRNHTARVNNRYLDDTGAVDMANGCRFEAFDVPGLFGIPANPGDRYDFDIRFFGDVRRNGRRMQRKFWAVRDNLTIP